VVGQNITPGRVLDAECCETTTTGHNQPAPKTPVTIEELTVSPGQGLARYFPRTEEARGSNPRTSTIEPLSEGFFEFRTARLGPVG
jgi:hypothetical protein